MKKKIKRQNHTSEQITILIIFIASLMLWNTPVIYPIKLFVVILHELSHAIMGLVTGGKITAMSIGLDLSGKCQIEGGNQIAIASVGYLGSLIWGILIYIAPNNLNSGKWILITFAEIILSISLITSSNLTFLVLSVISSLCILLTAFYLRINIISILVRSIGLISCVFVLFDLKEDLFSRNDVITDVTILSSLTGIPGILISTSWIVFSFFMIAIVIRYSYKKKS
jgi:Peptidase M50B-like